MRKTVIWASILFLIALVATSTYLFNNAENIADSIIRDELLKKYNNADHSKYIITIADINLNIISGSIKLENIEVLPKDSLVVLERNIDGRAISNTTFTLSISEVALSGFDILDALNNRKVSANKFSVKHPVIKVYQHVGLPKEREESQDTLDLRSIFLHSYDMLNLGEISFHDISTSYHAIDSLNDTTRLFAVSNLSYQMFGVLANKSTLYTSDYFMVEEYLLNSKNIEIQLKKKATISIKSLKFDSKENDLEIGTFNFEPNSEPDAFLNALKYRKGWVDFGADKIILEDIDISRWFAEQSLYLEKIKVVNPELKIHTKDHIPFDPKEVKPMLGEMILGLPLPFYSKEIEIENAKINLDITGKTTTVHGKLKFHDMHINGSNLTNIPEEIEANNFLNINAKTKINKTGKIHCNLKVNLQNPSSITQFTVNATQIKFVNFNDILKPILRVSLTDGKMVSLKINSTLSTNGAFGTMDAHYTSLKLQLESKDLNKNPGFFNNMASGLANGLIKKENIPGSTTYHQGKFQFKKTQHDNFFKMLWLVTLHGLEDSILGSESKDQRTQRKKEKEAKPKKKLFNFK